MVAVTTKTTSFKNKFVPYNSGPTAILCSRTQDIFRHMPPLQMLILAVLLLPVTQASVNTTTVFRIRSVLLLLTDNNKHGKYT